MLLERSRDALPQAPAESGREVEGPSVADQAEQVSGAVEDGAAVIAPPEMEFQARPQVAGNVVLYVVRNLPNHLSAADFDFGLGHSGLISPGATPGGGRARPTALKER